MNFSKWLYNLGPIDYTVISALFIVNLILSLIIIKMLSEWNKSINKDKNFAKEFRASPIALFALSSILTTIFYLLLGNGLIKYFSEIINQ
ncbi:MAG: hypothetical protein CMG08_06545 [Candidatus Marinimicrobia bacterium]|nr:hypothetical protein [Candidatus Neomarinimicrobiota bacterium]